VLRLRDPRPQRVGYVLERRDVAFGDRWPGYERRGVQWVSEALFE
jgi:hypothetical protein